MAATPIARPAPPAYPAPRKYTYADFLALNDDGKRYEIIEGVLFAANAPSYERQYVSMFWIVDPKTRAIEVHVLTKIETGETEYVLLGSFGPGEAVQSSVLPGIDLATAPLFAPA